jgi:N-acyl homoserine lactone hydrolase
MTAKRMWLLNCGWIGVESSLLMYRRSFGVRQVVPVTATIVETDEGYLLFDTGLNIEAVADPEGALGSKAETIVELDEDHGILAHLAALNISTSDVRWLTNSHLHWDHTGGNKHFEQSEMLIQREELRFAGDPDEFVAQIYMADQYGVPIAPNVIDGDYVVADGVGLISTRGHTPGHQSLLVALESGTTVLCAGDAAYSDANVAEAWPPGNAWSMPDAYRSLRRLAFARNFAAVELVIGHEPALWKRGGERIREMS